MSFSNVGRAPDSAPPVSELSILSVFSPSVLVLPGPLHVKDLRHFYQIPYRPAKSANSTLAGLVTIFISESESENDLFLTDIWRSAEF